MSKYAPKCQGSAEGICAAYAELEKQLAEARELLTECRIELGCYIDEEWAWRDEYPHQKAKWQRDMEIVYRIDKALAGGSE